MEFNHLAVLAAAVAAFVLGALWYSPVLFAGVWMRENKFTEDDLKDANMPAIFGGAFALMVLMAYNLAAFLGPVSFAEAIGYSVAAGLGWASFSLGVIALFERRSFTYVAIHAGYITLSFVAMGAIIGGWK